MKFRILGVAITLIGGGAVLVAMVVHTPFDTLMTVYGVALFAAGLGMLLGSVRP